MWTTDHYDKTKSMYTAAQEHQHLYTPAGITCASTAVGESHNITAYDNDMSSVIFQPKWSICSAKPNWPDNGKVTEFTHVCMQKILYTQLTPHEIDEQYWSLFAISQ